VPTEVNCLESKADLLLKLPYLLVGMGSDPDWAKHVQSFPQLK